jgi:hypothetical protein
LQAARVALADLENQIRWVCGVTQSICWQTLTCCASPEGFR